MSLGTSEIFAATTGATTEQGGESLLALMIKGGPVMVLLGICSLICLAIALERWISLSNRKLISKDFFNKISDSGKIKDFNELNTNCKKYNTLEAKIISAGIVKWQKTRRADLTESTLGDTASRNISKMRRSLLPLVHIAVISPFLGLLGTVTGLIKAFQGIAASAVEGGGKTSRLAGGIYEVMVNTAAGLVIAIAALVFYYYLMARLNNAADSIEVECNEFLDNYIHQPADNK